MDSSNTFTAAAIIEMVSFFLGGLFIFLHGMKFMSDGVQATAGEKLGQMIARVTDNRIAACGTGIFVTSLIQSSSVTTVMLIGLVNAGVMTLSQSIGVILGADIGTTVTAWIVAIKVTKYGLLITGVSGFIYLFTKNERRRFIAMLIMGLGLVFFGLQLMAQGVAPFRHNEEFISLLSRFSPKTYLGVVQCVLVGSIVTGVIQSSSATIAITITLARTGMIDFDTSVALVLGENIGTTITAFLGSLGMNIEARRVAYAHILIKLTGVTLMLPFFFLYMQGLNHFISPSAGIATRIAIAHTVFNILLVVVFLPFTKKMNSLLVLLFKDKGTVSASRLTSLDIGMLESPMVAIEQSRVEILKMGKIVGDMLTALRECHVQGIPERRKLNGLFQQEELLDKMQTEVVVFLTHILTLRISTSAAKEIHEQLRRADEYESISDNCIVILKFMLRLDHEKLYLDDEEKSDVLALHDEVMAYFDVIYKAHQERNLLILPNARVLGDAITHSFREKRERHLSKLCDKKLPPLVCTLYPDMLNSYRRIKDHLINVAEAIAGLK
ncbi:MAG: Na/Pi cotransporter family protein [Deltaproteobacteria bacterium]|nr:Na/Pi cotransporter family protein [Deltaproteobacteria bacterium]